MGRKNLLNERALIVYKFIREFGPVNLSTIARDCRLSKGTVYNSLRVLEPFIERESLTDKVDIPLPRMPVYVTIKEGATSLLVTKWLNNRHSLEGI